MEVVVRASSRSVLRGETTASPSNDEELIVAVIRSVRNKSKFDGCDRPLCISHGVSAFVGRILVVEIFFQ